MSEVLEMVQRIVDTQETGAPEFPMKIPSINETMPEEKKKKRLNLKGLGLSMTLKMTGDMKSGEGRKLVWHGWTPKLVKTQY